MSSFACTSDQECSRADALSLLHLTEDELFTSASQLRHATFDNSVELCAIINARSGHCDMNCAFCSQSRFHGTTAPVFPLLSTQELQERVTTLTQYPIKRVGIVTSGGALPEQDVQSLISFMEMAPAHWQGRLCGSLGRLPQQALQALKDAGLTRYHHNLESSENFYPQVCSTQKWRDRLNTVLRVQALGLECCSGGLFGMGESWEDRIDFALSLRENAITHVPLNFLYAHKGTPLEHVCPLTAEEALRIIAVFRHILPTATLRICGGRPHVLGARQQDIFAAGANALMTGDYLTTKGKGIEGDIHMLEAQGLQVDI